MARSLTTDHPVERYGRMVLAGQIPACEWVKKFCQRHFDDLRDGPERGLGFSIYHGERILNFFRILRHSKGEWAGQRFELAPWQQFYIFNLFGWLRKIDGLRRFRTAYTEIARKNGKSTLSAGIGLYLFLADDEPGAEVYAAATKKDQAKIVWGEAQRMVKASPALNRVVRTIKNNLSNIGTNSKFEPLASDSDTLDGLNLSGAIVDELHAHKSRDVWDLLQTATGSRRQPMVYAITTAGHDRQSVCYEQHDYTKKVLSGVIQDDAFFGFIATLDQGDQWEDPNVWIKSNPNLGVSVRVESLEQQCLKAKQDPASQNAFLRLRMWTSNETAWITFGVWDQNAHAFDESALEGRVCYGGLDLASTTDTASCVYVFPPEREGDPIALLPRIWIPEDNMRERGLRDHVPYEQWAKEGWLLTTPGNIIDYDAIRAQIVADYQRFAIQEIRYDRWASTQLSTQLSSVDGIEMIPMGQGFASMSSPMKELMRHLLEKNIAHGGHPVLRWQASNVMARMDPAGNIKPDKEASHERIDGIVASIMAMDGIVRRGDSVYESEGIKIL
jgi:phage terminase large subunit-like protein